MSEKAQVKETEIWTTKLYYKSLLYGRSTKITWAMQALSVFIYNLVGKDSSPSPCALWFISNINKTYNIPTRVNCKSRNNKTHTHTQAYAAGAKYRTQSNICISL